MAKIKPMVLFVKGRQTSRYSRALERYLHTQGYHPVYGGMPRTELLTASEARAYADGLSRTAVLLDDIKLNLKAEAAGGDKSEANPTYYSGKVTTNGRIAPNVLEDLLLQIPGVALVGHTNKGVVYASWRGDPARLLVSGDDVTCPGDLVGHLDRLRITNPTQIKVTWISNAGYRDAPGVLWDCQHVLNCQNGRPVWSVQAVRFDVKRGLKATRCPRP